MDLFKSFQKKKPPDDVSVVKFQPPDAWRSEAVNSKILEAKSPPTQLPEKGRSLISTLKFKPEQQSQGEVKVRRKEICAPDNSFHPVFVQTDGINPLLPSSNIPNMRKLEASQSCDLEGFKVKALPQKMVPPEDGANVVEVTPSPMPDFQLLEIDCDMNNEPPAHNPTTHRLTGKNCRRRGSSKSKCLLK